MSGVKGPSSLPPEALRKQLEQRRAKMSLRELARRIGVARTALEAFLGGRRVRGTTLTRIEAWLTSPGEEDVAERLRADLRRLLVGRVGLVRARQVEGEVGKLLNEAFRQSDKAPPRWLRIFGKKDE